MRLLSVSLAAAIVLSPSAALAGGNGPSGSFDRSNLDTSCKPCDDFNRFANGGWMEKNPIPAEFASYGTFVQLRERNLEALHGILERAAKGGAAKGSVEQKIGDFYASAMNTTLSDAEGLKPLQPELDRVAAVSDAASLQAEIARLHALNVDAAFGVGSMTDSKNSTQVIAAVGQGGLGLPDRDYYFKDDEKTKQIREAYVKHVARTLELAGYDAAKAAAAASTIMSIETRFAGASLTNVELRDPDSSYHMMTAAERKALTPGFSWEAYFPAIGSPQLASAPVNVAHPKFFQEFDRMLTAVPLADWKTYLSWRLLDEFSPSLSTKFVDENFDFNSRILLGAKEQPARWKVAVRATDASLGDLLGQAYVKEYFSPESKRRVREMVGNLKIALRESVQSLKWMGDATRKQALAKLDAFVDRIGYPDKWKDYSALELDRSAYAVNSMRTRQFAFRRTMNKIGKPVERAEWGMTAPTVNAGYSPSRNDITFPAGILQPPFFDPNADDAINYGAIGAVIGHEMTHGFDDQGARYDAEGNLKDWWSPEDLKNFQGRAVCIQEQFSSYSIGDGTHLKGKLVSGESIADFGGLTIAYRAFEKSLEGKPRPADVDGFTPEQRFFLGFARVWAGNYRPEFERFQTETNEHPLGRFRVNGTVSNMPEFRKAWGCKEGDAMARPDAVRCQIW